MRRLVLLATTLLLTAQSAGASAIGTLAYLDEANGFRDVNFGASLDSFTRLEEAGTEGPGRLCYRRIGDELVVGNAHLSSIRYCFSERRLWAVVLEAIGPRNTEALQEFLTTTYGPGSEERGSDEGGPQRYVWRGDKVGAYYGDLMRGMSAEARIWSIDLERSGRAVAGDHSPYSSGNYNGHAHHDPRPLSLQGRGQFSLNVPQHAKPGLTVQISARYRNLGAPARVRIDVPPAMRVIETVPPASIEPGGIVVWNDVSDVNGSLKIKAQIHPAAEPGRALLIRADIVDGSGGRSQERDTIVLR